jgi:vesicle coat complex subunit
VYRYANEVDVDFVRKSVHAIGRCAIKIDEAAERCINVLLDLINTGVSYVVQEAIVVIKVSSKLYFGAHLDSIEKQIGYFS